MNVNSEPLSLAPQQMRDKSRNDCQSLVLAQKCVCQTPPPCAGAVSKGMSPKGGAFSPPYGMSPTGLACFTVLETLLYGKCVLHLALTPETQPPSLLCGEMRCESSCIYQESHGLSCFLSELCPPPKTWKIFLWGRSLVFCCCRERAAQGGEMIFFFFF